MEELPPSSATVTAVVHHGRVAVSVFRIEMEKRKETTIRNQCVHNHTGAGSTYVRRLRLRLLTFATKNKRMDLWNRAHTEVVETLDANKNKGYPKRRLKSNDVVRELKAWWK